MHRIVILFLLILALSACHDPNAISTICANNSSICSDLNEDKWCNHDRDLLIRSRLKLKKQNTTESLEKNQYRLMLSLKNYQTCIHIAASIEPMKNIDVKSRRVEAMITTFDELTELEEITKDSLDPYLLYYHWQYKNNRTAKYKLLEQSDSPAFDTAELQFALANIYSNKKTQQTIISLIKGISFIDKADTELLTTMHYALITAYIHEKKYKLSYLWSKIAINQDIESINLKTFRKIYKVSRKERRIIDKLAAKLADKINRNEFSEALYIEALTSARF